MKFEVEVLVPHGCVCDGFHLSSHGYGSMQNAVVMNTLTTPRTICLLGISHKMVLFYLV